MKILHIIPALKRGGAERLVVDVCNELNARTGYEAKILLLHSENDFDRQLKNTAVTETNSRFEFHVFRKSHKDMTDYQMQVSAFSPDVINSHLFEAEFISREVLFPGVKYFSHLHDYMVQFSAIAMTDIFSKSRAANLVESTHLIRNYRRCQNHFIANSSHTENFFRRNLPADLSRNLVRLHNAVNLKQFQFINRNLESGVLRLVTTGSLVPKKNHGFLLEVVKKLKEKNVYAELTVLGSGPLQSDLTAKAVSLGVSGQVFLKGGVDNVADYLAQTHLYVHAATYEPFGLALLEAMATGLPVITLNGGGNSEFMISGKNGFLMQENNSSLFAERILNTFKDENQYHQLSEGAHATAEQFSITKYVDQLILLYNQA